jgi:Uma2 family endonuclease
MVAQPSTIQMPIFTVAEYFALEGASDTKHEYVDGHIYAMSGGTLDHDGVANNVRADLTVHLRHTGTPCLLRGPDVQLHTGPTVYYYPDALVLCGHAVRGTTTELHDATLIVEVLSASTATRDRGEKFDNYQNLPSFAEYLLVDGRTRAAARYRREPDGSWTYRRYGRGDVVTLETIAFAAPLDTFYALTSV